MELRAGLVVAGAVLALVALACWLSWPDSTPEPSYRGKTLSAWLDDRHGTPHGPVVLTDEAVAALRAMGPEAIPTLLAWLRQSDSSFTRGAKVVLEWHWKLPVHVPSNFESRGRAMCGFRTLGLAARSAFPEIVAIALNSPDEWQRDDAINALCESDADTMRRLAEGLKSPDPEVRLRAIFALTCLRIAPDEVCLPALEGARNDPDPRVSSAAAKGISFINQQLSAIARCLTHRDPEVRASAARFVGGYRTRASSFLPALEAAARDADSKVRAAAARATEQVRGHESSPTWRGPPVGG